MDRVLITALHSPRNAPLTLREETIRAFLPPTAFKTPVSSNEEDLPGCGVEGQVAAETRRPRTDLRREEVLIKAVETSRELRPTAMQGPDFRPECVRNSGCSDFSSTWACLSGRPRTDGRQLVKQTSKAVLSGAAGLLALVETVRLRR